MWAGFWRGKVILGDQDIRMKSRHGTFIYPWKDVIGVRSFLLDEEPGRGDFFSRLPGRYSYKRRVVKIQLNRSIRASVVRARYGPRVAGIPFGGNKATFFVKDPDALFAEISRVLDEKTE